MARWCRPPKEIPIVSTQLFLILLISPLFNWIASWYHPTAMENISEAPIITSRFFYRTTTHRAWIFLKVEWLLIWDDMMWNGDNLSKYLFQMMILEEKILVLWSDSKHVTHHFHVCMKVHFQLDALYFADLFMVVITHR